MTCPSQWHGRLDDGRAFYVRFRWGHGYVAIAKDAGGLLEDAIRGEVIVSWNEGNSMNGVCSWDDVARVLYDAGYQVTEVVNIRDAFDYLG